MLHHCCNRHAHDALPTADPNLRQIIRSVLLGVPTRRLAAGMRALRGRAGPRALAPSRPDGAHRRNPRGAQGPWSKCSWPARPRQGTPRSAPPSLRLTVPAKPSTCCAGDPTADSEDPSLDLEKWARTLGASNCQRALSGKEPGFLDLSPSL